MAVTTPIDEVAVEAMKQIMDECLLSVAPACFVLDAPCIITAAYKPRLAAERKVWAAAKKLVDTFPATMPKEPTKFNIPAYIVQELREAITAAKETSDAQERHL